MATTNEDLAAETKRYVPDEKLTLDKSGRREGAVTAALEKFSTDMLAARKALLMLPFHPRVVSAQISTNPFDLSALTDWDDRYSTVLEVEWPYVTEVLGVNPKQFAEEWTVDVEDDEDESLRVAGAGISPTAKARIIFASKWTALKLPPVYEEPVVLLAASLYATGLSGVYGDTVQPEFGGVPFIETSERSTTYKELGETLMGLYRVAVGLEKVTTEATA